MSNPTPELFEKTTPAAEKTGRQKTDKLWIAAAVSAILMGASAGTQANDGLLNGVLGSVNQVTSSLTSNPNASSANASVLNHTVASLDNNSLDSGLGGLVNVAGDSDSLSATTDVHNSAQAQVGDHHLGEQFASSSSVNLDGVNQANSVNVRADGAIVLR